MPHKKRTNNTCYTHIQYPYMLLDLEIKRSVLSANELPYSARTPERERERDQRWQWWRHVRAWPNAFSSYLPQVIFFFSSLSLSPFGHFIEHVMCTTLVLCHYVLLSGFGKACVASSTLHHANHRMTAYSIVSQFSLKSFQAKSYKISAVQNGSSMSAKSRKCIVLDIEGTTTPISFVFEVLFPYARDNVRKHLIATYDTDKTKDDIKLLRAQVEDDLKQGLSGAVPIPPDEAGKDSVIEALVPNVEAMIKADRKITSLKQLQGHIWRTGFEGKEIQGVVFDDVPEALKRWHENGIKVYIYSSGSREAQRLIFGNTTYGDLRPYLCGFFDTMIGNKRESKSYYEITQSVGVDKPSEVLFITDVYPEAVAAKSAGLDVLISLRPGNAPLPEGHGFPTVTSFAEV